MTKQEFVNTLRLSLKDLEDTGYLNETVSYYENYIETEVRKGSTEEEVISMLGDPRLIAKSVIASREATSQSRSDSTSNEQSNGFEVKEPWFIKIIRFMSSLPQWAVWFVGALVVVLFLALFIRVAPFLIIGFGLVALVRYIIKLWNN